MAVLTLVSMSDTESSHPADLAISSADCDTADLVVVSFLIHIQTCCISFLDNFV